jgi:hypothetical protein
MKRALVLLIFIASLNSKLSAQIFKPAYEFGLSAGVLVYQGDLTPERFGAAKTMKFAMALHAGKILGPAFALRGQLLRGSLKGDDSKYKNPEYRQQRNFRFKSPVTELSLQLVWNPLGKNETDNGLSPYIFAGGGFSFLHIKRNWEDINTEYFAPGNEIWNGLAIDSAKNLPRVIPVVPLGAGLRYYLNAHWSVNLESSYRLNYTDYLDGFSQSVNPERNDHYINYQAGVIYRNGKKNTLSCPKVRY